MADFSCHAVGAVPDLPMENDPSADSGAEGEKDHASDALACAPPLFTKGRSVGVVLDEHRYLEGLFQFCLEREVVPIREIGRFHHDSLSHIDDSRRSYADSRHLVSLPEAPVAPPPDIFYEPLNDPLVSF